MRAGWCLAAALIGLASAPACGYRFSVGGGQLPDGGRRVSIPMAENRTVEPGVAERLTRGLRLEAQRAGLELAEREEPGSGVVAPPVLRARVTTIEAVPRAVAIYGGRFRAREQEVLVRVELSLQRPGQADWKLSLTDKQSYLSAPDLRGTEANRQLAVFEAIDRLAVRALDRLARGF